MNALIQDVASETVPDVMSGRTFAAKQAMLVAGDIPAHLEVPTLGLKEIEVACDAKYLEAVLFERAIALGSPVIAAAKSVLVGAYSYMNSGGYIRDRVIIGRYCSIGRRVTIGAGMHNMSGLSTSPFLRAARSVNAQVPFTNISHDVWIGDGVVIMPGISVGTGAVIGANAVVTRDVPDYSIVGGVPARQIGMRFEPKIVQRLIRSEFWEFPREQLNNIAAKGVEEFLDRLEASNAKSSEPGFATYSLRTAACT